jgi:hypothetical protein
MTLSIGKEKVEYNAISLFVSYFSIGFVKMKEGNPKFQEKKAPPRQCL